MFSIYRGSGFGIRFSNGWQISVQFGPGTHSDHHDYFDGNTDVSTTGMERWMTAPARAAAEWRSWESDTAEVAVLDDGGLIDLHGDQIMGYMSADKVAQLIGLVSSLPPTDETTAEDLEDLREAIMSNRTALPRRSKHTDPVLPRL